jgi:hypothetical protein
MTIITFQNQECLGTDIKMTKQLMPANLFNNIFRHTLKSVIYTRLLSIMQRKILKINSSRLDFSRVIDVLDAYTETYSKYNAHHQTAMSHFNKLGMILSHKGVLHLNPFIESRATSRTYEPVITFYNMLWSHEFKDSIEINYGKGISFTFCSVEDIRRAVLQDGLISLEYDEYLSHLTFQQLDEIVFHSTKKQLYELGFGVAKDYRHKLQTLQAKLQSTYRNVSCAVVRELASTHLEILKEQLPLENVGSSILFGQLPPKFKCIHFSETNYYKDLEAQSFQYKNNLQSLTELF